MHAANLCPQILSGNYNSFAGLLACILLAQNTVDVLEIATNGSVRFSFWLA
jgi:hypothetical protein